MKCTSVRKFFRGLRRVNWQFWVVAFIVFVVAAETVAISRAIPTFVQWIQAERVHGDRQKLYLGFAWFITLCAALPWSTISEHRGGLFVTLVTLASLGIGFGATVALRAHGLGAYAIPVLYVGSGVAHGGILIYAWQLLVHKTYGKQRRLLFAFAFSAASVGAAAYRALEAVAPLKDVRDANPVMFDGLLAIGLHALVALVDPLLPDGRISDKVIMLNDVATASGWVPPGSLSLSRRGHSAGRALRFAGLLLVFFPALLLHATAAYREPALQNPTVMNLLLNELPSLSVLLVLPAVHMLLYHVVPMRSILAGLLLFIAPHYLYNVSEQSLWVQLTVRSIALLGLGTVTPLMMYYTAEMGRDIRPAAYGAMVLGAYALAVSAAVWMPEPIWWLVPSLAFATPVLLVLLFRLVLDPEMRARWRRGRPSTAGSGVRLKKTPRSDTEQEMHLLSSSSASSRPGSRRGLSAEDLMGDLGSETATTSTPHSPTTPDLGNPFAQAQLRMRRRSSSASIRSPTEPIPIRSRTHAYQRSRSATISSTSPDRPPILSAQRRATRADPSHKRTLSPSPKKSRRVTCASPPRRKAREPRAISPKIDSLGCDWTSEVAAILAILGTSPTTTVT